jgi:hypothetical protein
MLELAQNSGPSFERIRDLLDDVGAYWILTDFAAETVHRREMRGILPPEAFLGPLEMFAVIHGQLPEGTFNLGSALEKIHADDAVRARLRRVLQVPGIVKVLQDGRARHRRNERLAKNPYLPRSTLWIQTALTQHLVKDGKGITNNDVVDLMHAVVPLRYAEVVCLDAAWVNFATKLRLPGTRVFAKRDLDWALETIGTIDVSGFTVIRPVIPRVLSPGSQP